MSVGIFLLVYRIKEVIQKCYLIPRRVCSIQLALYGH